MGIDWIKKVMVIGAGTMGHSIALVFAQGGYHVDLVDLNEGLLGKAIDLVQSNLRTLGRAKLIDSKSIPKVLSRIHTSTSLKVAEDADLVVEAIREDPRAKKNLFRTLDRICPDRAILTSNTSYLNIFRLVKTGRPERILIAHWWAPPHLIPLVDVVKGPKTSMETVSTIEEILIRLGKKPVVLKKFIPGYIVNRLQRAMAREIFHLIDGGYASPEDIDTAVKNSLGIRLPVVGVVQRYDYTGLDLALTFEKNPSIHLVSKDVVPQTLIRLVKKGYLGVKTGRGFYDYSSKPMAEALKDRDVKLIELLKFLRRWDSNP